MTLREELDQAQTALDLFLDAYGEEVRAIVVTQMEGMPRLPRHEELLAQHARLCDQFGNAAERAAVSSDPELRILGEKIIAERDYIAAQCAIHGVKAMLSWS